jgi:hypothetical protein
MDTLLDTHKNVDAKDLEVPCIFFSNFLIYKISFFDSYKMIIYLCNIKSLENLASQEERGKRNDLEELKPWQN